MNMGRLCSWVMVLVLLIIFECCLGCWEQERIALLRIKADINFPIGTSLSLWVNKKTANCCDWEEVKCSADTGRVIQLSLNYTRQAWRLGDWYFNASLFLPFQELRTLHLRRNSLVGWVENEGFERLSMLSNLHVLDLSYNRFNNSILPRLSGLSALKYLSLSWNFMEGSERLSRLNNLEFLDLSYNSLNGSVLSFLNLNDLFRLKELDLSFNRFQSFDPIQGFDTPTRLSNLEVVNLMDNQFDNATLSFLGGLPSLKFLDLSRNQLKGSVHMKQLDGLTNLEVLDLSYNEFDSLVIPKGIKILKKLKVLHLDGLSKINASNLQRSIGAFSSLETLSLGGNEFEGTFTAEDWGNLLNLEALIMDSSSLSNNFLQSIGVLTSLKNLSMVNCEVNGTLPIQDLGNLLNLEALIMDSSSLSNNFLQSIGVLTSLKTLSMANCTINGTLPTQGLCELKNLQELDLSRNQFEGVLPPCLGNLTSLRWIELSSNQFTGNIASSPLSTLTSLEYLSLSRNHFEIPDSFSSFANHSNLKVVLADWNTIISDTEPQTWVPRLQLKVVVLSNCKLGVALPSFLYYQHDLGFVDLSYNNLGGRFPTWLLENNTSLEGLSLRHNSFNSSFRLPSYPNFNMSRIDISDNNVTGQIPTNLTLIFPSLHFLNLSNNAFGGYIPSCLGNMNSLWVLDLSNNHLSGGIPEQLANSGSNSLWFLKLSDNNLHGQIFSASLNLPQLELLYLDGNSFASMLPKSLPLMTSLILLDISRNHLSGNLPKWVGNMTYLSTIAMFKNNLEGSIPIEFCRLDYLEFLDLSENNISGSIPSCLNQSRIRQVHLNKNRLEGPLTRAFYNNTSLVTLDLSDNKLTGNIPEWIGSLSALSILLLKSNQFEGGIPSQLCKLNGLSIMDLSHNNLSGPIPHCLSNITLEANDEKSSGGSDGAFSGLLFDYMERKNLLGSHVAPTIEYRLGDLFPDVEVQVEVTTKSRSDSHKGKVLNYMSAIDLSCNQLAGGIPVELGNLSEIRALNLSHNNLTGTIPSTFSKLRQIESLDLSYNNLNGSIPTQLTELTTLAVFSVAHNNLSGKTPERKAQFGTFEENSYEGNSLLCGPPLHNNCTENGSPPPMPNVSNPDLEEDGFVDMHAFYVTFVVSYIIVLLAIATILYINPYWRRAWFHFIEVYITSR